MRKNQLLCTITSLVLTVIFFSACSPDGAPLVPLVTNTIEPSATAINTATPTEALPKIQIEPNTLAGIHILVASAFAVSSETQFSDLVARYNTLNEWGIIVYPVTNDSYNSLYETVDENLETPDQPDLVITMPEQVLDWDAKNSIIDLTEYMNDPVYGFSEEDTSDFTNIFWKIAGKNDRKLYLPAQLSASYLYFNQTWASELGFTRIPLTSSDFHEQACAANQSFRSDSILQNDGYGGWIVNSTPGSILAWLQAFGDGVVDGGQIKFSSETNQTALKFLKNLYDNNCAFISSEPNPYTSFANRSALFISADLAEIPNLNLAFEQANNQDEWTLIPFPGTQEQLIAEGPVFSILKSTPEKQLAAWLFTRWFLSRETQVSWVEGTGMLPLRGSTLETLSNYSNEPPQWKNAITYLDQLSPQPGLAEWRKGRLVLGDATNFMFRNNISLDQISNLLVQMDDTLQELLKSNP